MRRSNSRVDHRARARRGCIAPFWGRGTCPNIGNAGIGQVREPQEQRTGVTASAIRPGQGVERPGQGVEVLQSALRLALRLVVAMRAEPPDVDSAGRPIGVIAEVNARRRAAALLDL